ncbi:cobalt ABC transporter permease [Rhodovulum steppense]|nr:cobalt ABC transporter permease [Rhodovulum steppense]
MRAALLILLFVAHPLPALAHKVVFSVYPAGDAIEGELGFSNGDMAAHQVIELFDTAGNRLGETTTDADGFFTYAPTRPVAHVLRADLGAGHVAQAELSAEEVAAILGQGEAVPDPAAARTAPAGLSEADKAAIAAMMRDEMRPLRREIAALREHHQLQSILGGIGYIAGLFGLGFYLAARRRLAG